MTDKLVPALIGGVIVGILSSIPYVNLCCCIWTIGGGVLAVMMYVKKSPTRVSVGEGAMLGAMAGVIGGAIYFVITNILYGLIIGVATFETQFKSAGVDMPLSGFALIILSTLLGAVILAILTAGGGALGIPIFEKRKDGGAPPAPPTFGQQPDGGAYTGGGGGYGSGA